MLKGFCILSLLLVGMMLPFQASGQTFNLEGVVVDSSGVPIQGASVKVGEANTLSDKGGAFILSLSLPSNGKVLTVRYPGYTTFRYPLGNVPPENIIRCVLSSLIDTLGTAQIEARGSGATMQKVDIRQTLALPNPSGDISGLLRTLAPIAQNNELSSQYTVRGGNFDENLVYINDIEIFRPLLARQGQQEGLSIINPQLVGNLAFSGGGFEARYGDKLASVLDISYREPDSLGGSVNLSLLGGGISLEGASPSKRFTFTGGARYRDLTYLLNTLNVQGDYRPRFSDAQAYMTYDLSDNLEVALLGYYGQNRYLSMPERGVTDFGTLTQTLRLNVDFQGREILENTSYLLGATTTWAANRVSTYKLIANTYASSEKEYFDVIGGYSLQELDTDPNSSTIGEARNTLGTGGYLEHARNRLDARIYNIELKGSHNNGDALGIKWGLRAQTETLTDRLDEYRYIDSADFSVPQDTVDNVLNITEYIYGRNSNSWTRLMAYLQNTWLLDRATSTQLTVGGRANYWTFNGQTLISPRVSLSMAPMAKRSRTADSIKGIRKETLTFHIAGGAYHQAPFYRELRRLDGTLNPDIRAQKSYHIIAGTSFDLKIFGRPMKYSGEVYYKFLRDIIPYEVDNVRIRYLGSNNAKGYATGVDMSLNGELVPGVPSWFTLGVLQTREDLINDTGTRKEANGEVTTFSPGYIARPGDQRVRVSVFAQDYLPGNATYQAHLALVFGTSLPFGPPDHQRYKDVFRTRPYRRVDLGFSKQLFARASADGKTVVSTSRTFKSAWLGLEIFNLLGINNSVSYLWVQDAGGNQYAIPRNLTGRRLNLSLTVRF